MEKLNFAETMKDMLEERMGGICDMKVYEPNIVNAPGEISLSLVEKGNDIGISVRMSEFFKEYMEGGLSMEEIAERIRAMYQESKGKQPDITKLKDVSDYETIKDSLYIRLVNKEKNQSILRTIPHLEYLDLAVVFSVLIQQEQDAIGSVTVTGQMMNNWGISLDVLHQDAIENGERLFPAKVRPMKDIISNMIGEDIFTEEVPEQSPMFVLTNDMGVNGASTLLYPEILEEFYGTCGREFYVLPSSVHELILLPAEEGMQAKSLQNMVQEVNQTLLKDEILSDHVYLFGKDKKLRLIA